LDATKTFIMIKAILLFYNQDMTNGCSITLGIAMLMVKRNVSIQ